jgi:DNA polymerase elongation subunit (family B)
MPDIVVFDIETYRLGWRIRRTRREDLDPARNTITTTGVFDSKELSISPVIRNLEEERKSIEFFLGKLEESRGSTLVGYNILRFDIPYLVYKSKTIGRNCDLTQFQPLDLYWILPYWLHNTLDGKHFLNEGPHLGNLWKFENVVKYILREKANPFSNFDVLRLWEEKRFDDIEKHLELDLIYTFSFFKSQVVQGALNNLRKQHLDTSNCGDRCPYLQLLQRTGDKASFYCSLLQETVSEEKIIPAIDVIDYPLPGWDVSWIPFCLE